MAGTDEPSADGSCEGNLLPGTRDYLEAIISGSLDGIAVFNEQQQLEYVNDAGCQFMGVPREQLIGRHFSDFVPPESRQFYQQKWEQAMASGTVPYEGNVLKPDGSIVHVLVSDRVIAVGGQKKCITIVKDISELKATHNALRNANENLETLVEERTAELSGTVAERNRVIEALRESEGRYRELVENCGLMVVSYDPECRICYVNTRCIEYMGLAGRDVVGKHVTEAFGPEIGGKIVERMAGLLATGKAEPAMDRAMTPAGPRWLWGQPSVVRDDSGKVTGVTVFIQDMTEQKLAEYELHKSEHLFRDLVNYAGFIVVRCSLDGTLHFMNDMGLQYGGRRFTDVAGMHMSQVWGTVMAESFMSGIRRALEKGKDIERELEMPFQRGTRWFWARYNLMKDAEGRPESVICFAHDITDQKHAEMKLKESEEKHRQLVETAGLVMAIWDLEGRMQFVNGLGASFLRCKPDDVLGKLVTEVFGPVLGGSFLRDMQRIVEVGFDDEHVTEMPLPGGVRWFWSKGNPIRDSRGKTTAVAVFARDVTEEKLAQQKVIESEARYRDLIEKSGLAVTYHGADARIILVNELSAAYLRGKPEDFIGRLMSEIVGLPSGQTMDQTILDVVRNGRDIEVDKELTLPVGRRFMRARFAIVRNPDGGVGGVVVFAQDHTEQTLAELALKESESRRRMLTDMAMEAIFMHDDGILLEANPKFYEMFGYQPEEILGKDIRPMTLAPESVEMVVNHYRSTHGTGTQAIAMRKDGTKFLIETRGVSTMYKGRKVRVGVVTDISDRVRAETELAEIREKMATAERLAAVGYIGATMAHEVNTPLSVMRLTLQMLMADLQKLDGQEKNLGQAETILREIDRVSDIMRRYREMSRPAREISDSADEIRRVPEQVRRMFQEAAHNVKLRINIGDEVPELLTRLGNINDAEQLMFVLVQNAVQAADSKKRETLNVTGCIKGDSVELRFADDCCGIPPENLAKIFEPFFSTKPRNIGTGLGLSIVRRLLQEQGGGIRVESQPGKGTTFIVTYPA